jgi:hypothetical protein
VVPYLTAKVHTPAASLVAHPFKHTQQNHGHPALTTPPLDSPGTSQTSNIDQQQEMGAASATGRATDGATRVGNGSPGRSAAAVAISRAMHLGAEHAAHQAAASHPEGPFSLPDHRRRPVAAAQHAREPQPAAPAGAATAAEQRSTRPAGAAGKGVRPSVSRPDGRAEGLGRWPGPPSARPLSVMPLARRRSGAAVSPEPLEDGADADGAAPADVSRA